MDEETPTALKRLAARFPDKSPESLSRTLRKHNGDYEAAVAAIRGSIFRRFLSGLLDAFQRCITCYCYCDDTEPCEDQRNQVHTPTERTEEFSQPRQNYQRAKRTAIATSVRDTRRHQTTAHGIPKSYKRKADPPSTDYRAAKYKPANDKKPEDTEPKLVSKLKRVVMTKCPLFANNFQTLSSPEFHRANFHREEAEKCRTRKNELLSRKCFSLAEVERRSMEKANHSAALTWLSENLENEDRIDRMIDVHFLYKGETLQALDIFLDKEISMIQGQKNARKVLLVITGSGTHSKNGLPILKPSVFGRLQERGLYCCEVENNPGRLLVHVCHDSMLTTDLNKKPNLF